MEINKKIKKLFRSLGPGFITGASDDDPSGIATYSQTGAQFGYRQLWATLYTLPFMIAVQEMCGRIGMVTGRGIAGVVRSHYSRRILFGAVFLLLAANTINIGTDLGAMASSLQLLAPVPFVFWLIAITFATLVLEIFVSYRVYAKYLKYLTFSLLAYVITAFLVVHDWEAILRHTLLPAIEFNTSFMLNLVAFLGTTISPYLFFWQANEEVEEEVASHKLLGMNRGRPHINRQDIRRMRFDTMLGMLFSNLAAWFIILTAASTLGAQGITNINTAADAAEALRPLAGNVTFFLFTLGILGTGLLTVPILAGSASYAVAEALGWKSGLYRKLKRARGFYGIITLATLLGLAINFLHIPPFKMLYYTAVINGFISPFLIVLILAIANNKKIMGRYTNSLASNVLGLVIALVMFAAMAGLLYTL